MTTPANQGSQETPAPDQPRKFAGKYDSPEALERGYMESAKEAQNLVARAKAAEDRARLAEMALETARPQRVNPVEEARARYAAGEATPEDLDIIVQEKVGRTLQPLLNAATAQSAVSPDLLPEGQQLLAAEPTLHETYQRLISIDPQAGAAYLESQVRLRRAEAGMHSDNDSARKAKESGRKDATILGGTSSESRTQSDEGSNTAAARRQVLIENVRKTKDFNQFAREAFRGLKVIHDHEEGLRELS